jgi:hypothetical protein
VGVAPHPSRKARWWNDRTRAEEALAFFRSARLGLERAQDEPGDGWTFGPSYLVQEGVGSLHASREAAEREALEVLDGAPFWTGRVVWWELEGAEVQTTLFGAAWLSKHPGRPGGQSVGESSSGPAAQVDPSTSTS